MFIFELIIRRTEVRSPSNRSSNVRPATSRGRSPRARLHREVRSLLV